MHFPYPKLLSFLIVLLGVVALMAGLGRPLMMASLINVGSLLTIKDAMGSGPVSSELALRTDERIGRLFEIANDLAPSAQSALVWSVRSDLAPKECASGAKRLESVPDEMILGHADLALDAVRVLANDEQTDRLRHLRQLYLTSNLDQAK